MQTAWYNYRTKQFDYLSEPPADFHDYISQYPAAQGMYEVIIKQGQTPILAALEVLKAMVGEVCPHPPEAQQEPQDV